MEQETRPVPEILATRDEPIPLGYKGEHLARRILFDIADWLADFGPGEIRLLHQRQGDLYPYLVPVTQDPAYPLVYWDVTRTDTDLVSQYGMAELRYYVPLPGTGSGPEDDAALRLVKSGVYQTCVLPAMGPPTAETPDTGSDWVEQVLDAAARAAESASDAAESAALSDSRASDAAESAAAALSNAASSASSAAAAEGSETRAAASATAAEAARTAVEHLTVSASTLAAGSSAAASKAVDSSTGAVSITFGIPKGDKGDPGTVFTPSLAADGTLSWLNNGGLSNPAPVNIKGPQGAKGDKGDKGEKGDKGDTGAIGPAGAKGDGVAVLGQYASLSALQTAVPSPAVGDAYLVGTAAPYHLYFYFSNGWMDAGPLQAVARDWEYSAYIHHTASGSPTAFEDGADAVPVKSLTVQIAPVQAGSGDPSLDNIRPISGVSSVTVTRTGKNILPFEKTQSGYSVEFPALTLPAGTYTFSYGTTGTDAGPWQIYLKRNDEPHVGISSTYQGTFTLSETTLVKLWIWRGGSAVPINNIVWAQLEYGSEATDYAEYKGTAVVTVPLTDGSDPLTIGGGTLNVTTGELTVTHRYYTLSPDDVTMIAGQDGSASGYFAAYLQNALSDYPAYHRAGTANLLDFLCDTLTPLFVYSQYTSRGIYIYDTASLPGLSNICLRVHISDVPGWTGGTTVNDSVNIIKRFLTDTPTSICYQLATPITYQLTPQEVTTLLGVNTIAADCGAVSVTYRADTGIVVEELRQALLSTGANL